MLSDLERDLLTFERLWWKRQGSKQAAIRDLFDLTETRYYQLMLDLISRPDAAAFAPDVVRRLRAKRRSR
jgi:hypothetical protein